MNLKRVRRSLRRTYRETDNLLNNTTQSGIYKCGKCHKIVVCSRLGVKGITPGQDWHEHMSKCKSKIMVVYYKDYLIISGYQSEFFYCSKLQ